ncbi:hypothetical protein SH467x_001557 [Pirellulaceae bacterium SH467]|jgi:hypothetical protein
MSEPTTAPPQPTRQPPSSRTPLLDRQTTRVIVFVTLFGVTGFLGLPLLWFSSAFSQREKIVWSVINTLYTLALIGITAAICWWSYLQFKAIW